VKKHDAMVVLTVLMVSILFLTLSKAVTGVSGETDPSQTGKTIDVFTQRGGVGPNISGGEFAAGEDVILTAIATYNNFPVQQVTVAFLVQNPLNQSVALLVTTTGENGTAETSFRIADLPTSDGVWTITASVEIASTKVYDVVTFRVTMFQAVGGYTVLLKNTSNKITIALYAFSLTIFIVFLLYRKERKKESLGVEEPKRASFQTELAQIQGTDVVTESRIASQISVC
jgi:hypothetical protein